MKKVYLLAMMLLCSVVAFSQIKKVAILEIVDKEGKVSYAQKLMLRSSLAKAVTNTPGYEAYDRTDMDAIMGEQDFQRTGMVSDDQIKRLGEMTGAAYILVAEAVQVEGQRGFSKEVNLFVTAKILNVETARTEQTDYATMGMSPESLLAGCTLMASKLLNIQTVAAAPVQKEEQSAQKKESAKKEKAKKEEVKSEEIAPATLAVVRRDKDYYHNGKYMSKKEYKNLLRNTCPEAFALYRKGNNLVNCGWTFLVLGPAIACGAGLPLWLTAYNYYDYHIQGINLDAQTFMIASGIACVSVGGSMLLSSIPMLSVGYTKRKKSMMVYNTNCEPAITYNLTAGQNGIGLAINF